MANHVRMVEGWQDEVWSRYDTFLKDRLGPAIGRDARRYAPVDTGELRDHIDDGAVADHTLRVTARTNYAAAVENGHRVVSHGRDTGHFVQPQPFLRPALFQKRGDR